MSEADDVYDIPGVTAEEVDHFIEMQRRAAQWALAAPGKISVTPTAPRRADALADFRFPGENESTAELQARQAAYNRAQAAGLIRVYSR